MAMKEIADDVLIEDSYAGVTLGAIRTPQGVVMIDSPLYEKDIQTWRTSVMKASSGVERLLVVLDEHYDRTIGARALRCPVISHERTANSISGRPSNVRLPGYITGSEWELLSDLGPIHWLQPEITFTTNMQIAWGEQPIELEHHPGSAKGAIWVHLPDKKVIFLGDAVLPDQPPFLASADLDIWQEDLRTLKSAKYRDYVLISGRCGMVTKDEITAQVKFLRAAQKKLEKLADAAAKLKTIEKASEDLASGFPAKTKKLQEHYKARMRWGFVQLYNSQYKKSAK